MKKLIIIGAGGYAKSVLDSIDYMNFSMVGFLDDIKPKGFIHQGYPVLGDSLDSIEDRNNYGYDRFGHDHSEAVRIYDPHQKFP